MRELSFRLRRAVGLVVTVLIAMLVALIAWSAMATAEARETFTGIVLLTSLWLLVLVGVRRRLPVLPLGSMSSWTQFHLYSGLFAMGVYVMHVPAFWGRGTMASTMSALFWLVSLSGLYGIYVSRTLPKRLTKGGAEGRRERVSRHRHRIAQRASELVAEQQSSSLSGPFGQFYEGKLNPFFNSEPSLAYVIVPNAVRRRRLLSGLQSLGNCLQPDSKAILHHLAELVQRRDNLDYQFALQLRLRLWLVVHGLLSITLLAAATVHGLVMWNVSG
jgi:hypothetical protein